MQMPRSSLALHSPCDIAEMFIPFRSMSTPVLAQSTMHAGVSRQEHDAANSGDRRRGILLQLLLLLLQLALLSVICASYV